MQVHSLHLPKSAPVFFFLLLCDVPSSLQSLLRFDSCRVCGENYINGKLYNSASRLVRRAHAGLAVEHPDGQRVHDHHDGQGDEEGDDGAGEDEVLVAEQTLLVHCQPSETC